MTAHDTAPPAPAETADADLVLRTRSGDREAFAELWRRHYRSGIVVATSVSPTLDADDLVQEAYARIYQSILKGRGPVGSFRAYLFTSIRNTAASWGRSRREVAIDELDSFEDPDSGEQATEEALDRGITARAFKSLPTRWQEVLWYTEIEQLKPAEVAPLLGMKAAAVSQLAFRAREGLREAWIQAHLRSVADGSDCQWTIERLGAYARGNLGRRDRAKAEAHLAECARCAIVAAEARDVSNRLALVLLPLVLGAAGSASYLASVQGGVTSVALAAGAVPALPDAVVVAPAVGGGTGSAASGSGGTAVGSAAGTGGGVLSTAGGVTALAVAATVVVGAVVAAAAVLPALQESSPVSEAAQQRESLDDLTVGPATGPEDSAAPEDETDAAPDEPDEPEAPTPDDPPRDESAPPAEEAPPAPEPAPPRSAAPAPSAPPSEPEPADPGPPPTSPVDPEPPAPEPPAVDPLPAGAPAPSRATPEFTNGMRLTLHIPVSGAAGSTVEVLLGGAAKQRIALDGAGTGVASVRPTLPQLLADASVGLRYVTPTQTGPTASTRLSGVTDLRAILAALPR